LELKIGGQAVIEGVMMRAPRSLTIAVRRPDGQIVVKKEKLKLASDRWPILKWPLLRGVVALFQSLVLGVRALNFSANVALEAETNKKGEKQEIGPLAMGATLVFALGLGISLFFFLPLLLTNWLKNWLAFIGQNSLFFNLVDGIIRVMIFLLYLGAVSLMRDIRRIFEYHGAEHKAVFTYEAQEELNLDNAKRFSTAHPRCGTSFLLMVMVISILVFALVPQQSSLGMKALYRVIFLPLIAGLSYEVTRAGGRQNPSRFWQFLLAPGLWLQKITAREPADDQIEVALHALQEALAMEKVNQRVAPEPGLRL
jgi:uncharacterized protein YqhQ